MKRQKSEDTASQRGRNCRLPTAYCRLAPRGTTAVEMATVIAIIGIASAIAVPRYWAALDRYHLNGAARRIAADLTLARHHAKATSAAVNVDFQLEGTGNQYAVAGLPGLDQPLAAHAVLLSESPYEVQLTQADFGGDSALVFSRFGAPDSGGQVTLARGGLQTVLTINPQTGEVSIP